MNSKFENNVDLANIPIYNLVKNDKSNDYKASNKTPDGARVSTKQVLPEKIEDQIDILNKFDKLTKEFNKNKNTNDKQLLINIVKKMREMHGHIIKSFHDQLKSQGNFNHEEFFVLSTLDTSYNNMRNVIKHAESIISGTKHDDNVLSNIHLNKDKDKDEDEDLETEYSKQSKQSNQSKDPNDLENALSKHANIKINPKVPTFILFFMDWCGHCKHFKPIWNEFDNITNKKYINIVKTNNDKLASIYKVNGFPSAKLFIDDQVIEFEGERTVGGLSDFINAILDVKAANPLAAN